MIRHQVYKCCQCQSRIVEALDLDCPHHLCIYCLEQILREEEKNEYLTDVVQIQCNTCSYQTVLSIALAYKAVRPLRQQQTQKSLVCMECLNQCFSIEQYLQGKHQNHQIQPIEKANQHIKEILFFAGKQLQQTKNKLYLSTQKAIHMKRKINESFVRTMKSIRIQFEGLKAAIQKKQLQVLQLYEQKIVRSYGQLDEEIASNRKYIEMCHSHLLWIYHNIKEQNSIKEAEEIVNYFINNRGTISQLQTSTNSNRGLQLIQQVRRYQKLINIQEFSQICESIRNINVGLPNYLETSSICSLKSTYFQSKRQQVKSKPRLGNHQQSERMNEGSSTLKKVASLKCKLLKL